MSWKVSSPCKLSYELFVPRGCVLRNTLCGSYSRLEDVLFANDLAAPRYVISIAAFCGPQTKTRSVPKRPSRSKLRLKIHAFCEAECC